MVKVLIADKMSSDAADILLKAGFQVDTKTGLSEGEIAEIIGGYDAVLVRSASKITKKIIDASTNLKIIGRAGVGVDNIDVVAATEKGIVVVNSPNGNATTTAEHAIALMFAVARKIPQANQTTQEGKWEKTKYTGLELTGKTLGVIGCGNIGSIVAQKAVGLGLNVLGYDPFLTEEKANQLGITKTDLEVLFKTSDVISVHTPLIESTKNIINKQSLAKTKKGIIIINCARGGLVNEEDLRDAVLSGHVWGAAIDVFPKEPIESTNPLLGLSDKVILTPHLGGSTEEAQEKVAIDVANQFVKFFTENEVTAAVNFPALTSKQAPFTKPYVELAFRAGKFVSQVSKSPIKSIEIVYNGNFANVNTNLVNSSFLEGLLSLTHENVNLINAANKAKSLGVSVSKVIQEDVNLYKNILQVRVAFASSYLNVSLAAFNNEIFTAFNLDDYNIKFELQGKMLLISNKDKPGVVAFIGKVLAESNINISNFYLGKKNMDARAIVQVDTEVSDTILQKLKSFELIDDVQYIDIQR